MATQRQQTPRGDALGHTRVISNLKNMFNARPPEDKLEDVEDISSVSAPAPEPIETDTDAVMSILMPHRTPAQASVEPKSQPEERRKPQTRVHIFTAAAPEQLEKKINEHLASAETNPKLNNLEIISTAYASNNQGYSVMLTYKLT